MLVVVLVVVVVIISDVEVLTVVSRLNSCRSFSSITLSRMELC